MTESLIFVSMFKNELQRRLIRDAWRKITGTPLLRPVGPEGYVKDGSRFQPYPTSDVPDFTGNVMLRIMPDLMMLDMQRLASLKDANKNFDMVFYESPIKGGPGVSKAALASRALFMQLCERYKLICLTAPKSLPFPKLPWFDDSHPDPRSLGNYLNAIIREWHQHSPASQ